MVDENPLGPAHKNPYGATPPCTDIAIEPSVAPKQEIFEIFS